jgi:hypothetical protein
MPRETRVVSLANDERLRGGSAAGERHIQWLHRLSNSSGSRVEVLIEIFRLGWRIDQDVRFGDRRPREIVCPERGLIGDRARKLKEAAN